MLKFKKALSILLSLAVVCSIACAPAFAEETYTTTDNDIKFVVLDDSGNEVEVLELEYIESVAQAFQRRQLLRWTTTTYYDLSNGSYTMYGGSATVVECGLHFKPNSAGRLYYYAEVQGNNATIDLYNITSGKYQGSITLQNQGNSLYSKNGFFAGLSTSTNYSYGLTATTIYPFSSHYAVISWNNL